MEGEKCKNYIIFYNKKNYKPFRHNWIPKGSDGQIVPHIAHMWNNASLEEVEQSNLSKFINKIINI